MSMFCPETIDALSTSLPCWLQVLWLHDCLAIWRSMYFLGHVAMATIILLGVALPPRKPKRAVQPELADAAAAAAAATAAGKAAGADGGMADGEAKKGQ